MNSKNLIKDTFIELYSNKTINKITVTELTKMANITRGTFYIYYSDIYEVLEEIENDLLSTLTHIINVTVIKKEVLNNSFNTNYAYSSLVYVKKNKTYFKALLKYEDNSSFKYKLKNIMKKNVTFIFNHKKKLLSPTSFDIYVEYMSSAYIGCLTLWVNNDCESSIEEILSIISRIFNAGVVNL